MRIDKRPFSGNADSTTGGEIGRWVLHCHIFSHAEGGMISELVVTGDALDDSNERPQMTVDDFDVTGFRGRTVLRAAATRIPTGTRSPSSCLVTGPRMR